ncbi:peptidase M48-like protein [Halanaerobium saccharolyticum]|uniref:Peptidase M48-like protein n=1 Tax=Halanaerobium saccharolyticum TaxID=43595 RepID=A0A2T5RHM2_9FIRM|nr:M48 family metallopeptidase [Halanaerobium saccharolyticum]PTV96204.1 peptidase M48-like protein [Halanaerobium saccharolyticum]
MRKSNFALDKVLTVILTVFLISIISISTVSAFSDYEKDVAERLYKDLDEEYRITEFRAGSLEYETLKRLEANVVADKFKDEEFKVHHIDDQTINAYYIGDGNIMLFEGLLQKLSTENQLAGLIAHEMGHAVEEHLTEDLERNLGLSLLNLLFNHFTDNDYQTMTNVAQNLIANGYSREQEQESDIYAVDLMMRSGYDPKGLIELMQIFKENSNNFKLLEFTQTHPIPESRIEYLKEYIAQQKSKKAAEDNNREGSDQGLTMPERNEFSHFENSLISFSYPKNWNLNEARVLKQEVKFKYQLSAENLNAEIYFEDLSAKNFMETARKQFNYAAIEAEENGYQVEKRTIADDQLDIYQLQLNRSQEYKLDYFISQKDQQQLLKLSFEPGAENRAEQRQLIEKLIESIQFK